MKLISLLSGILFSASLFSQEAVQININPLLNARIITTLSDGKLITWPDALDNGGSGMATQAAANKMSNPTAIALPDDGAFKANSKHPYVKLNFSNSEPTGNQVHRSVGVDSFLFDVPKAKYSKVLMFFMSGAGNSSIRIILKYADGSEETKSHEIIDWYYPIDEKERLRFDIAVNMGKWGNDNKMMEFDHHYLMGLDIQPNKQKTLISIKLSKTEKAVLTLWGVTGVKY